MSSTRRRQPERGGAYLLALAALLILTGLGIALSDIAVTERRLGTADQDRLQALNAAESGLAIAAARLVAGAASEELEVVFGARRSAGLTRASRVRVEAPDFVGAAPCESCAADGDAVGKVSFALGAVGERVLWAWQSSPDGARTVARASVEAILTLQPWPLPGLSSPSSGAREAGTPCGPEVRARLLERLVRELNPPECRFGPRPLAVRARDAESGSTCSVEVPVCALLTDWRER